MAAPVAGAPIKELAQVAQQAKKAEGAPKTAASKFDQAMVDKAQGVDATKEASAVQKAQAIDKAQKVGEVQKTGGVQQADRTTAVKKDDPVTGSQAADRPRSSIESTLTQIESRTTSMDKFIADAVGGKVKLSPQQLLGLQAKVSEYSLELDLTGKVVEKATSGLKDTLHTQV